jgi:hypothetical protein
MRNYVIEFVNGLRQVDGLLLVLRLPPLIKLTTTICTNVIEILLNETFIIIATVEIEYFMSVVNLK